MSKFELTVQAMANRIGVTLLRNSTHQDLIDKLPASRCFEILREFDSIDVQKYLSLYPRSKSQLSQDMFVAAATNLKLDGFFVEFGATDGIALSNTYLLETQLGWRGILAEPAQMWHSDLRANRRAFVSDQAVWNVSGAKLEFMEDSELSTLLAFGNNDEHHRKGKTYEVLTTTLDDLLSKYDAPDEIDFLSIDTEGSEFEVLEAHDFDRYRISIICVEHNYTEKRERLFSLLTSKGYRRVLEHVSQFDDWYILG